MELPKTAIPTLPMQLAMTLGCWLTSPSALQCASAAWPRWNPKTSPDGLQKAVRQEAGSRANNLLSGILRYMETPWQRDLPEPPAIWKRGNARLLDYSLPQAEGRLVLFIPSLINRYYILDLEKDRSLLRWLAGQSHYPLALDWGEPGTQEKDFGCEEYITHILLPAIDHLYRIARQPITLAGYCMGGVFALAAAKLVPEKVAALALLATPWDFHCKEFAPFVVDGRGRDGIASLLASQETLPAEVIQALFYMTDPWVFEHKFRRFAGLAKDSRAARDFIALERWVNDGVPMTAGVAKNCLIGWAQENQLAAGQWTVNSKKIDPKTLRKPTFIAIPKNDHVVPYDCAWPLAKSIKHAWVIQPGAGHVGMIVGSKARRELWQPLNEWLSTYT